jgi:hypothetical protein
LLPKNGFPTRLVPKLIYQLLPAVIVTVFGIALLGNLSSQPEVAPATSPAETAIEGEAIFKITPRQNADMAGDKDADTSQANAAHSPAAGAARAPAKPKAVAANAPVQHPRKPGDIELPPSAAGEKVSAPLALQPDGAAAAAPSNDNFVSAGWRRMTTWTSGWFTEPPPPRPPAAVPDMPFVKTSAN